jgi:hypothetical protein
MTQDTRRRFIFSVLFAIAALLVTWLILTEALPLSGLARNTGVAAALRATVLPAFVLGAVITRNPHSPPLAIVASGLFLQWFVVGYLLSIPICRVARDASAPTRSGTDARRT